MSNQTERIAQPLTVAVDGSHNGEESGYGFITADGRVGYGSTPAGPNAECVAIAKALDALPDDRPLTIRTDSDEAFLRFVDHKPARAKNPSAEVIAAIEQHLAERPAPVMFVRVSQSHEADALHAAAHLLAFLGRTRREVDETTLAGAVESILTAADPNTLAHQMVTDILFPATATSTPLPTRPGPPLSDDVEHYLATCAVHGLSLHARHRVGQRAGAQRYRDRCLRCHSAYNLAHPGVLEAQPPRVSAPETSAPGAPVAQPEPEHQRTPAPPIRSIQSAPSALRRATVIHAEACQQVHGRDLRAGDVLPTGVVLEVTRNDIDGEARLEMTGADIHYVDYDEEVTVLARLDRDVLVAISVGVHVARFSHRRSAP